MNLLMLLAAALLSLTPAGPVQTPPDLTDALRVDTGGRLGTLAVTARWAREGETALFEVWDPAETDKPLQTIVRPAEFLGSGRVEEINFDGYPDFSYTTGYFQYLYCIWDEEQGRFVPTGQLDGLRAPAPDPERRLIVDEYWGAESTACLYQWEEGELVLVRRLTLHDPYLPETEILRRTERYLPDYDPNGLPRFRLLTVEDRDGSGEMTEIFAGIQDESRRGSEEPVFDPRWYGLEFRGAAQSGEQRDGGLEYGN